MMAIALIIKINSKFDKVKFYIDTRMSVNLDKLKKELSINNIYFDGNQEVNSLLERIKNKIVMEYIKIGLILLSL